MEQIVGDYVQEAPPWQRAPDGGRTHPLTETVPLEVRDAFKQRWARVADCIALRSPDRMPTSLLGTFWYARYGGITCRQLMYDFETGNRISEAAVVELDPDIATGAGASAYVGPLLDQLDFRQLEWAGHGAGENSPYQYLDREYMTADEYDEFIFDPTGYLFAKYLPRVAGAFDGLQAFGAIAGNSYLGLAAASIIFQAPGVTQALGRLRKAGEEAARLVAANQQLITNIARRGYPPAYVRYTQAPYDVLADYMRGARNMMTDLYRRPEKIRAALEKLEVLILRRTLANSNAAVSPIMMIPLHWAADRFMSQKHFAEYYWPSLRKLMLGLIDRGFIPMPLWEADCSRRLDIIGDVPAGSCIYWFEGTDMARAFAALGGRVALHGNVPASVLTTGTPDDVDAAVRHLAENVFHRGGRLILSAAMPMPEETPIENARAMFRAARTYGR